VQDEYTLEVPSKNPFGKTTGRVEVSHKTAPDVKESGLKLNKAIVVIQKIKQNER
jgi:hypothetical protein